MESRAPSGLFPSGPPRPSFREPHPVRLGAVLIGAGMAAAWLLLVALLASSAATYVWFTIGGTAVAWGIAALLLRSGDRGAATGIALTTSIGASVAIIFVVAQWMTVGWPLW